MSAIQVEQNLPILHLLRLRKCTTHLVYRLCDQLLMDLDVGYLLIIKESNIYLELVSKYLYKYHELLEIESSQTHSLDSVSKCKTIVQNRSRFRYVGEKLL